MNKKIAFFSPHSDPLARLGSRENGGQNLYIKSLVQNLDASGWTVDVFTRFDDKDKKEISKIGQRSRVIRIKGGPVTHIPKGKLHPFFPELYENFLKIGQNEKYELFHGHHYDGGWMALKAHNQFNKPLFITFHSLGRIRYKTQTNFLGRTTEDDILNERFAIEQEIVDNASIIIELADSEKKHLEEHYQAVSDKIRIIPGGVNITQFKKIPTEKARDFIGANKNDFIILFVGRLEWRKGVATLIHALRLVKEAIPSAKLIVVGGKIFGRNFNKDDRSEYERLKKNATVLHSLGEDVKFTGAINHGDLPKYYSAANVLVVPSYYEPFGLVAVEGLASKIPVIASRVGGLKVTIKDEINGLLFEQRNPSDLAKKIILIHNSNDLVEKLVKSGYQDVLEHYSWENIAEEISKVYEEKIIENGKEKN